VQSGSCGPDQALLNPSFVDESPHWAFASSPPRPGHLERGRTGRRKIFVLTAATAYGLAMFAIAIASSFNGHLVRMAIGGLGFGVYMAVDLTLVADVLPDTDNNAPVGDCRSCRR